MAATTTEADDILTGITIPSTSSRARFVNWGLSYECQPLAIFEPENERQCELVLEFARREGRVLRAVGVGHSPSDLACTGDFMLKMTKMNRLLEVNQEKLCVVVEAGITLTDLHVKLARHGLAMRNLGSISDQTLGGIVATASHGSGIAYQVLSAEVLALTLLLADGSRVTCSRVILTVHLAVEHAFRLKDMQCARTFEDFVAHLDELVRSAQHARFWWIAATHTVKCSAVNRTCEVRAFDLCNASVHLSIKAQTPADTVVLELATRVPRGAVLPLRRFVAWLSSGEVTLVDDSPTIFNVECRYPQHTTEWAIPFTNAPACLRALRDWMDAEAADPRGLRPHFPFEIRFSAADDIWLSPSFGQETCWIGIAQYKPYGLNRAPALGQGAPALPPAALRTMYPRYDDFVRVLGEVDPGGVFRNEYVRRHVFGEGEKGAGGRVWKVRERGGVNPPGLSGAAGVNANQAENLREGHPT
ncbi:L-gulonolactone D-arabinono-1,4-lactone oxidase [Mycena olivaceomarginata]|nr:L-gulonolactone D-arabinono-1,4-lactone oxidase [Mycena olivaceomarginata]